MTAFRLLTPDAQYADDGVIERRTAGEGVSWSIHRVRRPQDLPSGALAACDAMVVWHQLAVDRVVIDQMQHCRIIVRAGVGFDHIDLQAAADAGIPVCNTPDYGTSEVADHAIGLMLALRRGIVSYHQALTADPVAGFDHGRAPLVRRVRGTTFGIVGLGRIGIATTIRAKAFGMRVVAYDPYVSHATEIALGVERVDSLPALLQQSDVVSLHCPLTEETRMMMNAEMLRLMKRDAILINTARGAVIDIPALLEALQLGTIAGAGIEAVIKVFRLPRRNIDARLKGYGDRHADRTACCARPGRHGRSTRTGTQPPGPTSTGNARMTDRHQAKIPDNRLRYRHLLPHASPTLC
ncbi:MAG TPA: C-terminal binding protein [Dongiaceae bacterium]|nr:C-terminal binding protein [Dongiaceae bacterium]